VVPNPFGDLRLQCDGKERDDGNEKSEFEHVPNW
jgi:hypothetical protein